jgi:hypothetical protein
MPSRFRPPSLLALIGLCALLVNFGAPIAVAKKSKPPAISPPAGLREVPVRGFQRSFVRPEADLATPRAVCINVGELTLDAEWPTKAYGKSLRATDLERLKNDFKKAAQSEFERAFRNQGGYTLAADDASCELRVQVSIKDLYLNAPEVFSEVASKTYARSIGRMGMRIDVLDAAGTVLLAQAHGRRVDPDDALAVDASDLLSERYRVTEVDNIDFARDTARDFAEYTRTRLLVRQPRS